MPYQLRVELIKIEKGREYFTIQEGRFKGKVASVRQKRSGKSYLLEQNVHLSGASLFYNNQTEILTIEGLGEYRTDMDHNNPLPIGIYDIEIPYEVHPKGARYMRYSRYAKTWFRIGHTGDRFIHIGAQSGGCITVTDRLKWTEIYLHLIKSRKDNKNIGTLTVE